MVWESRSRFLSPGTELQLGERFADRDDAGEQLAAELVDRRVEADLVLSIPRGVSRWAGPWRTPLSTSSSTTAPPAFGAGGAFDDRFDRVSDATAMAYPDDGN